MNWLYGILKRPEPPPPPQPKYRLQPKGDGRWWLEAYHADVGMYLPEATVDSQKDADRIIANLERDVVYYRENIDEDSNT